MDNLTPRYRRGDPSPVDAGLVFHRYWRDREAWVPPERLASIRSMAIEAGKKWKRTPAGAEAVRMSASLQNKRESVRQYRSAYYKQAHVRKRYRDKYENDPDVRKKSLEYSRKPEVKAAKKTANQKPERKAKIRAYMRPYLRDYMKRRYESEPEFRAKAAASHRRYNAKNRAKINARDKLRREANPSYRISINLRNRVRSALKSQPGSLKAYNTEALIGCTMRELLHHLQYQFTEGMSISGLMNGKIHIDHRIPCAMFDLTNPAQQLACFNFRNLRPMWAKENISKSDKIEVNGKLVMGRKIRKVIPFVAIA